MPNHYAGDLRHTLAISGLSHVRTELPHLLVIPLLPPHPVESNREFPRHDYLGNPSLSSHGQVEKPAPPVGVRADRDLGRLHQQKAQQRVTMFGSFLPSLGWLAPPKFTRAWEPTLLWNHYTHRPPFMRWAGG